MQASISFFLSHRDKIAYESGTTKGGEKAAYVELSCDRATTTIYAKTPEELVAVGEEIVRRARELMPTPTTGDMLAETAEAARYFGRLEPIVLAE